MALTGYKADSPMGTPSLVDGIRYPSDDGEPMADTELQYYAITDTVFALWMHLRWLRRTGTVRGNCALYGNPDDLTDYVAPDVLFVFDVRVPAEEGYAPWEHGKVPDMVMEMASPSTYRQDLDAKWTRYAALGIAEYWQYDPHHRYLPAALMGWQLQGGAYEPIPLRYDAGRQAQIGFSRILGTDWGLVRETGALRLWNAIAQTWYLTDREAEEAQRRETARADAEAARANAEAVRAARAETEISRLQALLRAHKIDAGDS